MARRATIRWQSPAPTAIDEELALYEDGAALLVVRGPHDLGPTIGTFRCNPDAADLRLLSDAGPEPVELNLLVPPPDADAAEMEAAAQRIAATGAEHPDATATFYGRADAANDEMLSVTLLVVGAGLRPVEVQLDPASSSVQFHDAGQPVGWAELPQLPIGFVTPLAADLGGLGRRGVVAPGVYGAITFEVPAPSAASSMTIQVAGWLTEALPDDTGPHPFVARTAEAALDR